MLQAPTANGKKRESAPDRPRAQKGADSKPIKPGFVSQKGRGRGKKKGRSEREEQGVQGLLGPAPIPLMPQRLWPLVTVPSFQPVFQGLDEAHFQHGSSSSSTQPPKHPPSLQAPPQPRRLWQQMAKGREDLIHAQAGKATTVWAHFAGVPDLKIGASHDEEEALKHPISQAHAARKESVTNCEAMSECSTADTTTTACWSSIHPDDAALAERIAAVLMDRVDPMNVASSSSGLGDIPSSSLDPASEAQSPSHQPSCSLPSKEDQLALSRKR
ncbi:unnamed protein product [Effrenium voratum]|nr:unnamed protein product [Effrenium voratum]